MLIFLCACLAGACTTPATGTPFPPIAPTFAPAQVVPTWAFPTQVDLEQDPLLQSSGGGEPRSGGYWVMWSSCGANSQAAVAQANGGRQAGWIILDDLLSDPGMLVGALPVESCPQGVALLQGKDAAGGDHSNDPAYTLAGQLLAAQLNLAAGAETCPAAETAVQATQLLLLALDFDGTGFYLGPPAANREVETARTLVEQLASYYHGELCR